MIALYIVAIPGFVPGVGRDREIHMGIVPVGSISVPGDKKAHFGDRQIQTGIAPARAASVLQHEQADDQDQRISHQDHISHDHHMDAKHGSVGDDHVHQGQSPYDLDALQTFQGDAAESPTAAALLLGQHHHAWSDQQTCDSSENSPGY